MKSNVDLTENRDFRKNFSLRNLNLTELESENTMTAEIILTGNKNERKYKKKWKLYEIGLECERCGTNFSNKPWNGNWGLCFKCENEMDLDIIVDSDLVIKHSKYVKSRQ